jgi:hypothetical protein
MCCCCCNGEGRVRLNGGDVRLTAYTTAAVAAAHVGMKWIDTDEGGGA